MASLRFCGHFYSRKDQDKQVPVIQIGTGRGKRKAPDLHKVHAIYLKTRLPKLYAFKIDMEGVHNIQKRILD